MRGHHHEIASLAQRVLLQGIGDAPFQYVGRDFFQARFLESSDNTRAVYRFM
jgi:hypothetical protein